MAVGPAGEEGADAADQCGAAVDEVDGEAGQEVSWEKIRQSLRLDDARMKSLLTLFQKRYEICTATEAFVQIHRFLGEYMVCEFDYREFCRGLGLAEDVVDDGDRWAAYVSEHLRTDLVLAASLMLRLAATIAKAHGLRTADWVDVNEACSSAIRVVPACYQLHRALPGALSTARAWRHLPGFVDGPGASEGADPWQCEEARASFEDMHAISWARIEDALSHDGGVKCCFSGCFLVVEVTEVEWLSLVSLEAVLPRQGPGGFAEKTLRLGDRIIWEVELTVGKLLQPGLTFDADWYELDNESCFMAGPIAVAPHWLHSMATEGTEEPEPAV